jgi:hypothetical protein
MVPTTPRCPQSLIVEERSPQGAQSCGIGNRSPAIVLTAVFKVLGYSQSLSCIPDAGTERAREQRLLRPDDEENAHVVRKACFFAHAPNDDIDGTGAGTLHTDHCGEVV